MAEVEAELSRQGIELDFHGEDLEHSDPMEVMTSAGLVVIQRRNTRRAASAVISGTDGMVQAELAADSVAYFFPETEILHYEVEIESKGPNGPTAAEAIAEYLLAEVQSGTQEMASRQTCHGLGHPRAFDRGLAGGLAGREQPPEVGCVR